MFWKGPVQVCTASISSGGGEIMAVDVQKDSRGAFVFGPVEKEFGVGFVTAT
jgi:hypothetical protein